MMKNSKPLIAITHRVDVHDSYGERRDALDQRWTEMLAQLGFCALPLPNHPGTAQTLLHKVKPDGFILTGGNSVDRLAIDNAPERDQTEAVCLKHAEVRRLPVLGVCRGFQFINCFLGGSVGPIEGHVGVLHSVVRSHSEQEIVNSYHAEGITRAQLATTLCETSVAKDGTIESAKHTELPWLGVMWHPERPVENKQTTPRELEKLLLIIGLEGTDGYV